MSQTQLKAKPRSRTLLVVDDREANLVAMEALLGDGDWQVHTVNSGEAALKALLELDVELVLLDVQMPGMDGFEVARLMRGSPHTRYTPIIFVSAIAHTRDSVLRGYATGAVDFILKPFDPQVLKHKINTLLAHEHNRRDLQLLTQQLDSARAFNASVLSNAAEGILVVAEDGYISFANPAIAGMLHTRVEDLQGTPLLSHLAAPEMPTAGTNRTSIATGAVVRPIACTRRSCTLPTARPCRWRCPARRCHASSVQWWSLRWTCRWCAISIRSWKPRR